jgi:hypothetical protein
MTTAEAADAEKLRQETAVKDTEQVEAEREEPRGDQA